MINTLQEDLQENSSRSTRRPNLNCTVLGFVPRRLPCFLLLLGVCVFPSIRSLFLWVCGSLVLGGVGVRSTMKPTEMSRFLPLLRRSTGGCG